MTSSRKPRGARREGSQTPTYSLVPRSSFTDGPTCGRLAAAYGLAPDPWQQTVLDGWLACRKDGTYVAGTCGLSVPRQNGKNGVLEMAELFKTVVQGRKVLHTAHEVKTARKAFLRLRGFFENEKSYPELADQVLAIRQTNGQEGIYLKNGGSVEFIARSKSSGRGFTVDDVVCDEAQEMVDEQLEVLRSTNSAAPSGNPQMIYTGTPTPPTSPGTVFERTRKNALNHTGRRLCWFEWAVDSVGDVRDRDRWYLTNPALGLRIRESSVVDELNSMSEDGFARERLGYWLSGGYNRVLDEGQWSRLGRDSSPDEGKTAFGVKFSPDGRRVFVAVCRRPKEGPAHVELVMDEPMSRGTAWLAQWLDERRRETCVVVMDGTGGVAPLCDRLGDLHYPPKAMHVARAHEVVSAAAMMADAVNEGSVTHFADGDELNHSAVTAEKRPIGRNGGWGWGGDAPGPIEAASLALWGARTSRRNPGRGSRIL